MSVSLSSGAAIAAIPAIPQCADPGISNGNSTNSRNSRNSRATTKQCSCRALPRMDDVEGVWLAENFNAPPGHPTAAYHQGVQLIGGATRKPPDPRVIW